MELVKNASVIVALLISVGTLVTVTVPGVRRGLERALFRGREEKEDFARIRHLLEQHVAEDQLRKEEMALQKEVDKCVLRDLITNIYYKYAKEKKIPIYALEDVTSLYELYQKRGGNSYVQTLVRQMTREWEVEN